MFHNFIFFLHNFAVLLKAFKIFYLCKFPISLFRFLILFFIFKNVRMFGAGIDNKIGNLSYFRKTTNTCSSSSTYCSEPELLAKATLSLDSVDFTLPINGFPVAPIPKLTFQFFLPVKVAKFIKKFSGAENPLLAKC